MFRAMEVEAVGSVPSPRRPVQVVGVTAELAATRKQLREAAPPDSWDGVLAEVRRLQNVEHMAPLEALRTVYAKLVFDLDLPPAEKVAWTIGRLIIWSNDLLRSLVGNDIPDLHHATQFLAWAKTRPALSRD